MGLIAFQNVTRYLLLLLTLTAFGFEMFFLVLYRQYKSVYFNWRYYALTGLVGVLILVMVFSEIGYRAKVALAKRQRRQNQFELDLRHAPYLPHPHPHPQPQPQPQPQLQPQPQNEQEPYAAYPLSSSQHAQVIDIPADDYHTHNNSVAPEPNTTSNAVPPSQQQQQQQSQQQPQYYSNEVAIRYTRPSSCSTFWSVVRFLTVWVISAGLLNITIQAYIRQQRTVFDLGYERRTDWTGRWEQDVNNTRDLYNCPAIEQGKVLTTLCLFDQLVLGFCSLAALLAIFEAIAAIILENRIRTTAESYGWTNKALVAAAAEAETDRNTNSRTTTYRRRQGRPGFLTRMKVLRRQEVSTDYNDLELGNALVVARHDALDPIVVVDGPHLGTRPFIAAEAAAAAAAATPPFPLMEGSVTNAASVSDRPLPPIPTVLPPLPPRKSLDGGAAKENNYNKVDYNFNQGDKGMAAAATAHPYLTAPFEYHDDDEDDGIAGPSKSLNRDYNHDIKRGSSSTNPFDQDLQSYPDGANRSGSGEGEGASGSGTTGIGSSSSHSYPADIKRPDGL